MEKNEILGPKVKFVLPVSNRIKKQLVSLHPSIKSKSVVVAYPGIHEVSVKQTTAIRNIKTDARFVFIGKEWKRKGLILAVQIIDHYASLFGRCTMEVYGPASFDLPIFIRQHPNLLFKGWSNDIQWSNYDALIHPATIEPFGMVVPEARSRGVPVLTTNLVGSTELEYKGVIALNASEPIETWTASLVALISNRSAKATEIKWTWRQLALKHMLEIYPLVTKEID